MLGVSDPEMLRKRCYVWDYDFRIMDELIVKAQNAQFFFNLNKNMLDLKRYF